MSEIENEITEIICELLDVEPFEVVAGSMFCEHLEGHAEQLRLTLECAFGVTIDRAESANLVDLRSTFGVVLSALDAKRAKHSPNGPFDLALGA